MRYLKSLSLLLVAILLSGNLYAQKRVVTEAKADSWTTSNSDATFNKDIIHLKRKNQKNGLLWLNDITFKNGTIELDIKGKDERGNSFVGCAFHGVNNTHYDAVYFRPFNFKSKEKHKKMMQYINCPDEVWHVLRKKFPGMYENSISPAPDPNKWFHVKIVVNYPGIKVYVNHSETPSLEVDQRSTRADGKLGLWIGSDEGWFKNIVITHKEAL